MPSGVPAAIKCPIRVTADERAEFTSTVLVQMLCYIIGVEKFIGIAEPAKIRKFHPVAGFDTRF